MRTLLARGLVEECGHDEETTAILYRTTSYFLERIGVTSIDELPELAPFLPEMGELEEFDEHPTAPAVADAAVGTSMAGDVPTDATDAPSDATDAPEGLAAEGRRRGTPPALRT